MERTGHSPDVFMQDDDFFYFGTCSKRCPGLSFFEMRPGYNVGQEGLLMGSLAYNVETENAWNTSVKVVNGDEQPACGNIVDIAGIMGMSIMTMDQFRKLLKAGVEVEGRCFLDPPRNLNVGGKPKQIVDQWIVQDGEKNKVTQFLEYPCRDWEYFRGVIKVPKVKS